MDAGSASFTNSNQTPNTVEYYPADTLWVLRSIVERETALTDS
jgi:hypothetical protein